MKAELQEADPGLVASRRIEDWAPFPDPRGDLLAEHSPEAPRKGEGSFLQLGDGRLLALYDVRAGMGDLDPCRIAVKTSTDEGASWSDEATLFDDASERLLQPSLTRLGNGEVGLSYSRLIDGARARKVFRHSADEGRSWSKEVPVSDGTAGYMTGAHDRLVRLSSGRLLSLLHAKVERTDKRTRLASFVYASDDHGRTWRDLTPGGLCVAANPSGKQSFGLWETSVAEWSAGRLLLVGRTASGWLCESRSEDFGDHWSEPAPTSLPNPLAPARLTRVPGSEALVLIGNPKVEMDSGWHGGERTILSSRVSFDAGRTWSHHRQLEHRSADHWFDYPFTLWIGETLHVAYRAIDLKAKKAGAPWRTVDVRRQRLPKRWLLGTAAEDRQGGSSDDNRG